MIHYAFHFCQIVEDSQDINENLIDATKRVIGNGELPIMLKTRDALRELAQMIENEIASR